MVLALHTSHEPHIRHMSPSMNPATLHASCQSGRQGGRGVSLAFLHSTRLSRESLTQAIHLLCVRLIVWTCPAGCVRVCLPSLISRVGGSREKKCASKIARSGGKQSGGKRKRAARQQKGTRTTERRLTLPRPANAFLARSCSARHATTPTTPDR